MFHSTGEIFKVFRLIIIIIILYILLCMGFTGQWTGTAYGPWTKMGLTHMTPLETSGIHSGCFLLLDTKFDLLV